jgi:CshA-type fibril repeat protein
LRFTAIAKSLLRLIDPDSGLPVTSVTTADGTFTANSDGTITFTPADGFSGVADPVTYQITDSLGQTDTATYTPTVIAPPVAVDDTSTGPFNTPQVEDVMADDSSNTGVVLQRSLLSLVDPDSGLPVTTVTTEDGTFTANSDGTITFEPVDGFAGEADPVTYQITDSLGRTDTTTYTPTVTAPPVPVAVDDTSTGAYLAVQVALAVADDVSNTGTPIAASTLALCVGSPLVCSTSPVTIVSTVF